MVRRSLFAIIKKKILLFLSLIFITTIGVTFSTGFLSCYLDYKRESLAYINNYGLPDILLNSSNSFTDDTVKSIKVDGADIFYRYQGETELKVNDKIYFTKVTTFDDNSFSKRYVLSEVEDSKDKLNINVDFVFGKNANIKAGNYGSIKVNSIDTPIYINKVVGNPESISYGTNSGVPLDRYKYGLTYINKKDVTINNNQIIVKITDTSKNKESVFKELKTQLSDVGVNVGSPTYKENNSNYKSIISTAEDMKKVAVIVPIVCISILLVLVFLFMYQVSKSLTHEFGIMIALGNSIKSILLLLMGFAFIVALSASILGIACGHGLSSIMYNVFKYSFFVPCGYGGVLPLICVYSSLAAIGVTLLAVFSTVLVIRRVSPLDAINNNKNTYKPLIKPVDKLVNLTGSANKIAVTSVCKERVRSFVSIFAIIASFSICLGSINLYKSEQGLIDQLAMRNNFEAEIYINGTDKISEVITFVEDQKSKGIIKEYEVTKIAYFKINESTDSFAFQGVEDSNMHNVYNNNNKRISINQENTVIIDELYARENNINVGDTVIVNNTDLKVQEIAHNCAYKRNYMTLDTMTKVIGGSSYKETICVNTTNLNTLINNLSVSNLPAQVLTMDTFIKTISSGYQAIVLLSKALVGLGIILGLATLIIMSITSMNEQKRKFCIMQSLGLKLGDVSTVIFIQNTIYLLLGIGIAIPCSMYFGKWMVDIATTRNNALFYFNYWWFYAVVGLLMILISLVAHLISIIKIKHTNLVENTCSRE